MGISPPPTREAITWCQALNGNSKPSRSHSHIDQCGLCIGRCHPDLASSDHIAVQTTKLCGMQAAAPKQGQWLDRVGAAPLPDRRYSSLDEV